MKVALGLGLLSAALGAGSVPALAAGSVQVSYVKPEGFTDVGFATIDRERTLQCLTQHFEALGRRLPDGQTLRVEVLDVNLAGEVWPRGPSEVRVLRGRADWPRMTLRYTVQDGSRIVKTGEAQLADMNYLHGPQGLQQYGDLPYEKRMLDNWFREEIAPAAP
jgi:hypothetical protein